MNLTSLSNEHRQNYEKGTPLTSSHLKTHFLGYCLNLYLLATMVHSF